MLDAGEREETPLDPGTLRGIGNDVTDSGRDLRGRLVGAVRLEDSRLRATMDLQLISWADTAEKPVFAGKPEFEDTTNFSIGFEYRLDLDKIREVRDTWAFYRDRRPDAYHEIVAR